MTILTEIPNGASNADVRATLNDLFTRIQTREGGTMPVLTQILNGSSLADVRLTLNDVLTRLAALENGSTPTPTPTPVPVGFYPNGATNTAFKAGFARVAANSGARPVLLIASDSILGIGQYTGGAPHGYGGARAKRFAARFAALHVAAGVPMLDNGFDGDAGILANYGISDLGTYDPRVILQGDATATTPDQTFTGGGIISTTANGVINFQLSGVDTFEAVAYRTASPTPAVLLIDGSPPAFGDTTLSGAGSSGGFTRAVFRSASVGSRTGAIVTGTGTGGGSINVRSMRAYNSAQIAWDIIVHASMGVTAEQLATAGNGYKSLDALKFDTPTFALIGAWVNGMGQGVSPAATLASIEALTTAARLTGDAAWVFPHPVSSVSPATQKQHRDAAKTRAATLGIPFIDRFERWGSGDDAGFAAGKTVDGVHLNDAATMVEATEIKQIFDFMKA